MANYNNLKADIDAVIKTNGRQEISGAALNTQLKNMITELGAGYQYMGIATPATNPGTPDANVSYLASEAGTYTNFGGIVINEGEVCVLVWNGTWTKQVTGAATADKLNQLGQQMIYDVTKNNPTAGPNNDGKFESLSALLSDANLSTLIPIAVRCGGMSIRFVQTSDNKYIQARLMADSFTTDITQWQGVDDTPTVGSNNLVKSGGVSATKIEIASINLTDLDAIEDGKLFDSDGNIVSGFAGYSITGYIPTKGNNLKIGYVYTAEDIYQLGVAYDKDYNIVRLLGYTKTGTGYQYEYQDGEAYVRFAIQTNWKQYPEMIRSNYGTTLLPYQPYNPIAEYLGDIEQKLSQEIERAEGAESDINNKIKYRVDVIPTITRYRYNTWLESDGDLGTEWAGTMYAYKFAVSQGQIINLDDLHLYTVPDGTLLYAFYNSDETFDHTTFISGSQLYQHPMVSTIDIDNIVVPDGAISIIFLNRVKSMAGGGDYSVTVFEDRNINDAVRQNATNISDIKDSLENLTENKKTTLYVKKDGTGDYTDIQSAINSIIDASATNRYEVRVCDDFEYSDLTNLYLVWNPENKNPNANPTSPIAVVITKPYVDVVGYERRRKVTVHSPYDLAQSSFQYVQCMYLQGTCVVDNIDFELKNGRYAIHQESGGDRNSVDYHAKTILRNCNAVHLGNADSAHGTAGWDSICGEAVGMCDGLELVYENVVFYPAYYAHGNTNFDAPNKITFKDCSIKYDKSSPNVQGCYITPLGSGQAPDITLQGCNFFVMNARITVMSSNVLSDACHDIRTYIPNLHGDSNNMVSPITLMFDNNVLFLKSNSSNVNVKVTGGTAKSLIWGDDLVNYEGKDDAIGFAAGTEFIGSGAFLLGKRLGNCTSENKTLIVSVGNASQTLTLSSDYSSMTNQQVVDALNALMSDAEFALGGKDHASVRMIPCKDVSHNGIAKAGTIFFGSPVVRDYENYPFGWKICPVGTKPEGISCERINKGEYGVIASLDNISLMSIRDNNIQGMFAKVGANGYWVTATESDADIVHIGGGMWIKAN